MRRMIGLSAGILMAGGVWIAASAGEAKKAPAKSAKVSDLTWLTGTWYGEEDPSKYCETWGKPANGAIVGMCHMASKKGVPLYELIVIDEGPNGLAYRIMHYGPGLSPKHPEPNVMPVIEATADRIVFMEQKGDNPARITYRRDGKDRIVARVEHVKNGKATGFDIPMKRG